MKGLIPDENGRPLYESWHCVDLHVAKSGNYLNTISKGIIWCDEQGSEYAREFDKFYFEDANEAVVFALIQEQFK